MENIQIVPLENTSMICTDDSANKDSHNESSNDSSNVASEYDVPNKTDETIAKPCPVHVNKPPDTVFIQAHLTVPDSGQPPGYVKQKQKQKQRPLQLKLLCWVYT